MNRQSENRMQSNSETQEFRVSDIEESKVSGHQEFSNSCLQGLGNSKVRNFKIQNEDMTIIYEKTSLEG